VLRFSPNHDTKSKKMRDTEMARFTMTSNPSQKRIIVEIVHTQARYQFPVYKSAKRSDVYSDRSSSVTILLEAGNPIYIREQQPLSALL
jgi:hypothetical protein